ncbi:uncharacterized protein LOC5503897 isoform X2 [Nematostella vectensis]|uniref:uncharacterized protein LOC5503897 isoform X2 n=1 Tax=Nematostella vectensis TaxID=45351 RepID=UPI002076D9D7|nr:uncharacterized protein LOC5503897 isoform X2 [Nematostella vectensis]
MASANSAKQGMKEEHRKILRKHRVELARDLEVHKVLYNLTSLLSESDEEEIKSFKTRQERAEELLTMLTKRGEHAFEVFVKALNMSNQRHLANILLNEVPDDVTLDASGDDQTSSEKYRQVLRTSREMLRDMDIDRILPLLGIVLDKTDKESINSFPAGSQKKFDEFLALLLKKGPQAHEHFARVLEMVHPDKAKVLLKDFGMEPNVAKSPPAEKVEVNTLNSGANNISNQQETSAHGQVDHDTSDGPVGKLTNQAKHLTLEQKVPTRMGDLSKSDIENIARLIDEDSLRKQQLHDSLSHEPAATATKVLLFTDTVKSKSIKEFTGILRNCSNGADVIKGMRQLLPAGITVDGIWKRFADKIGMSTDDIKYLDQRTDNPADGALSKWELRTNLSIGHLYDMLNELGMPLIADRL